MSGRAALGRHAEDLAIEYLVRRGARIVDRNWRSANGEIDIVADDRGTCVFVEVRSRTGTELGHPLETVDARKRARIIRAARTYLDAVNPVASGFRFDVIAITFDRDGRSPQIEHVVGAFELGAR